MPSNNTGQIVKDLFEKHPEKIALLLNPNCLSQSYFKYRYAIDNSAFKQFNEKLYLKMLIEANKQKNRPMFVVVPDVVGCHDRTLALWNYYWLKLKNMSWPHFNLAFVAQDGCEPDSIPSGADWIFIGGKDPWKMDNVHKFVGLGRPVHVGRVNGIGRLKYIEELGVDSCDGTGWLRGRNKQFYDFIEWFQDEPKQQVMFK